MPIARKHPRPILLGDILNAGQKWLQLGLEILSYEFGHSNDGQLLSEGADRLIAAHPILGRTLIFVIGEIIVLHLANMLPDRYDVMCKNFWKAIKHGQ